MGDPARLSAGSAASKGPSGPPEREAEGPTEDLRLTGAQPPPPQETQPGRAEAAPPRSSITRVFGSALYFRLWLAQFASSLGDWIGFVAITAISNRIAGTNGVALVLSARLVPGFFLGSVGGLLADRLDRKKLMVACDVGRGVVVGLLPFVHTLPLLFLINLVLEALTLLWTPAKEATVPNLVREEQLPKVNSLGLAAAYGTFPLGAGMFTALAAVAAYLGRFEHLSVLKVNQENLAIWTDTLTFLLSAFLISTLAIPRRDRQASTGKVDFGQGVRDVREGWRFIGQNATVRSVILAMSCGLIGGGMVVPLGPGFARDVLGGGPRAFGALITAAGLGVALGVVGVSSVQKRLRPERVFVQALLVAGSCLIAAASMSLLTPTLLFVGLFGMAGGAIYVFGFSLVQAKTEDEMRGRIFSALYAAVRLCIVLSFVLGPLLASLLDRLSRGLVDGEVAVGGWHVALPGSRLALWLAGGIILGSGFLARRSLRADAERRARLDLEATPGPPSPAGDAAESGTSDPGGLATTPADEPVAGAADPTSGAGDPSGSTSATKPTSRAGGAAGPSSGDDPSRRAGDAPGSSSAAGARSGADDASGSSTAGAKSGPGDGSGSSLAAGPGSGADDAAWSSTAADPPAQARDEAATSRPGTHPPAEPDRPPASRSGSSSQAEP